MIGILDWGIGGVGVLAAMRARARHTDLLYLSDAGAVPYGKLDARALAARVTNAVRKLEREGASHVVIACNAASTVLPNVRAQVSLTGMVEHARRALAGATGPIGVVGGARTIRSGVYRRALSGNVVRQRIAQPLSAHIEAGMGESDACERDLARITRPLRGTPVLLLACTHYPAIAHRFAAHLPGTRIVDPAATVASHVLRMHGDLGTGRLRAMTTGDARATEHAAERAFSFSLGSVERCVL
jgi:glutamate racemase